MVRSLNKDVIAVLDGASVHCLDCAEKPITDYKQQDLILIGGVNWDEKFIVKKMYGRNGNLNCIHCGKTIFVFS